jgi:hypothetical protein
MRRVVVPFRMWCPVVQQKFAHFKQKCTVLTFRVEEYKQAASEM